MYIAKNKIPVSNVNGAKIKNWYLKNKNRDDEPEFNYISIPGLGYAIPMMPTTILENGDRPDLAGEKKTFTGTVEGTIYAIVENDINHSLVFASCRY